MGKEIRISTQTISGHNFADPDDVTDYSQDSDEDELELPVDIARKGKQLIIRAPVVGVTPDEVNITVNNDTLFIHKSAMIDKTKVDNYYLRECHWGPIAREVRLPIPVDPAGARASLTDGILTITLPIIHKPITRIIKVR
ncbi:hypothetical protein A2V68_00815 [candidate division Kazan bacterium RBG_13_50_9]|uniref:SHSP domain-containing protein n=1 Tax=candidate division Kazan bacterium RBG_13_50_9 TaxID=1798535 RepID=A0A1F4NSM7_UNCK3|nr:MAG: hypothetical protein A2V68_00815 [candidate division Kazan bacterium RBG_13_50_9]